MAVSRPVPAALGQWQRVEFTDPVVELRTSQTEASEYLALRRTAVGCPRLRELEKIVDVPVFGLPRGPATAHRCVPRYPCPMAAEGRWVVIFTGVVGCVGRCGAAVGGPSGRGPSGFGHEFSLSVSPAAQEGDPKLGSGILATDADMRLLQGQWRGLPPPIRVVSGGTEACCEAWVLVVVPRARQMRVSSACRRSSIPGAAE